MENKSLIGKSAVRTSENNDLKLKIIKKLAQKVDLNNVAVKEMISDYLPEYKNTEYDFKIGRILLGQRQYYEKYKKITKFGQELCDLGFNINATTITKIKRSFKKDIIKELAKVVDLNDITHSGMISDFLPKYKDTEYDFAIGVLLANTRAISNRDGNIGDLGELCVSLGYKLENVRNRHSAKQICDSIDKLIEKGIDLKEIKIFQMLSEFLPDVLEKEDFCIGAILYEARHARAGEKIMAHLRLRNFDFKPKNLDHATLEKKIEILEYLLTHGVNLDEIGRSKMLSDFIFLQPKQKDYPVGLWINQAKCYTADRKLIEMLKKYGLKPYVKYSAVESLKIAKRLVLEKGINLNDLSKDAKASDFLEGFEEIDYAVGEFIFKAKQKTYRNEIIEQLNALGMDIEYKNEATNTSQRYAIIADLVNRVGLNINTTIQKDRASNFDKKKYFKRDYPVGEWINEAKTGRDLELQKLLLPLGLKPVKSYSFKVHDVEFKKKIVRLLIANGINLNEIKNEYKLTDYLPDWEGEEIKIGSWFKHAKNGLGGDEFLEFLASVGFSFEKKFYKGGKLHYKEKGLKVRAGAYDIRNND